MALKVRDLLRRRSSLAEEVALADEAGGGSAAEVFEVTNLVLPAGTDLSGGSDPEDGPAYEVGQFVFPVGQAMMYTLQLELAEDPGSDSTPYIWAWWGGEDPNQADYGTYGLAVEEGFVFRAATGVAHIADRGFQNPPSGFFEGRSTVPVADDIVRVGIQTPADSPLVNDVTIVRARASFLLF